MEFIIGGLVLIIIIGIGAQIKGHYPEQPEEPEEKPVSRLFLGDKDDKS